MNSITYKVLCLLEVAMIFTFGVFTMVSIIFGYVGTIIICILCAIALMSDVTFRMIDSKGFAW